MDIIILADFCGKLDGKGNSRFLYLADMFCKEHDVEIITSDFDHGTKSYFRSDIAKYPYKITMLHEGQYSKNICLRRFLGHYIWGKSVAKYLKLRKKPDLIYCAVPTLWASYEAAKYCEENKVKFVVDVQDLWPEAFQMVFNVPVISNLVFAPFELIANEIYKRADEVIAVSETYVNRALKVNNKGAQGHCVFLGTRLENFDVFSRTEVMREDIEKVIQQKCEGEIWLAYCGTLGHSYDLICVMDALWLVKEKGIVPPKFIVMGDGPRKKEFEEYAKEKGLDVFFTGMLDYSDMCRLLCKCNITVNPIVKGAAQSIINKHADYAASGLPVLNTQDGREYINLVNEYEMGLNSAPGNAETLEQNMIYLLNNPSEQVRIGKNARRCAEERFDRQVSYKKICEIVVN